MLLIASADGASSATKDTALATLKGITLDTEEQEMAAKIYQIIFGDYSIYYHFSQPDLIQPAPFAIQVHLMYYL